MSSINIIKIVVDSKSELKEKLRNSTCNHLILGKDSQIERNFFLFRVEMKYDLSTVLEVGVVSESHGLQPECKLIDDRHYMYWI